MNNVQPGRDQPSSPANRQAPLDTEQSEGPPMSLHPTEKAYIRSLYQKTVSGLSALSADDADRADLIEACQMGIQQLEESNHHHHGALPPLASVLRESEVESLTEEYREFVRLVEQIPRGLTKPQQERLENLGQQILNRLRQLEA